MVPITGRPVVLELGPGTGAVSEVIQQRIPTEGRHLAVEVDPQLAGHLHRAQPRIEVIHGDAAHLLELLDQRDVRTVDAVVSGLPWTLIRPEAQRLIIAQIAAVLTPGAGFTTFAYLHARRTVWARRFHALLTGTFEEVVVSRTVWRNLPPARTYVCRRPVPDA